MKQETKQTPTPSPSIHEEGKFTKGDWQVFQGLVIGSNGLKPVTICDTTIQLKGEEQKANATLIASAPKNYEDRKLLIETINWVLELTPGQLGNDTKNMKDYLKAILNRIK